MVNFLSDDYIDRYECLENEIFFDFDTGADYPGTDNLFPSFCF